MEQQQIWLSHLREGKEHAYRLFFDDYYQILVSFAVRYIRQKEAAEDVVHDVIVEMYRRKPFFENTTALKSYLFISIRNRCLNLLRDGKMHADITRRDGKMERIEEPDKTPSFLDNIIQEEVYLILKNTISKLPYYVRRIYELSLEEKSHEEIAHELALTVDSVKAYKKRGKKILKNWLNTIKSIFL